MLLRSRMHCLSPSDNPNRGRGVGRKGIPPRLLSTNVCRKLDNTRCGVPAIYKVGEKMRHSWTYFSNLMALCTSIFQLLCISSSHKPGLKFPSSFNCQLHLQKQLTSVDAFGLALISFFSKKKVLSRSESMKEQKLQKH